ncbi:hypothetical protein [Maritalea porphyrae]|uniref:hypothetical protein n=1 Tax=Maritalea porphyrae TaxID=880732 RepID=UPI0022AFCCF0|nr:hypothetical protein [Maritalea porphyrae]MCZ4273230.1 hypothetical protein [Maritalea porphyrae]
MARTLLGILQLKLQQNVSSEAKQVTGALKKIEAETARLGAAKWGVGFQRQLDKLKVSPAEYAAIVGSYDRLAKGVNGKISKADFSAWRGGVTSHLTATRAELDETRRRAEKMHASIIGKNSYAGNIAKSAMVAFGAYTLWYGAGVAMREGFMAGADRQREFFRQKMAGVPQDEQDAAIARAQELTLKYPSVGLTEILEMFRTARNTMGNTGDGLAILEDLVRGQVTLQSSQGTDVASSSMLRLIRGLDNMGINSGGEVGIEAMKEIIAGAIRAAQIEGSEIDVGSYFDFARRSKIAGPALSDEFLATTAPVLMQDMTSSTAGNAIAMFFKAFITGAKDTASKVNIEAQKRIGIRDDNGLVDAQLAGENPYEWTKKYLVPALEKSGVDMSNELAISKAIADLSRNSNATGLLTRMVTQSQQIERLIGMYGQAMGPDAADLARNEDPYVSAKGFSTSLQNLAAAFGEHVYPVLIPGMNSMADGINSFAQAVREADGAAVGLTALATGVGAFGAIKVGKGIFDRFSSLGTAGLSLQKSAVDLTGAAAALKGSAAAGGMGVDNAGNSAKKAGWLAAGLAYAKKVGVAVAPAVGAELLIDSPTSMDDFKAQVAQQAKNKEDLREFTKPWREPMEDFFSNALNWAGSGPKDTSVSEFEGLRSNGLNTPLSAALEPNTDGQKPSGVVGPSSEADPAILDQIRTKSSSAAQSLSSLGQPVELNIGDRALDNINRKLRETVGLLDRLGGGASSSSSRDQVNSSFADYGVTP